MVKTPYIVEFGKNDNFFVLDHKSNRIFHSGDGGKTVKTQLLLLLLLLS